MNTDNKRFITARVKKSFWKKAMKIVIEINVLEM